MREACWALSNLTAASTDSIDRFIESPCYPQVLEIAMNTTLKRDVRKEANWVLCNSITGSID